MKKPSTTPAPDASIDQCGNCVYWEDLKIATSSRGLCHIISYPDRFKNPYAILSTIEGLFEGTKRNPATAMVFMPVAGFHCTLFKTRGTK